MQPIRVEHQDDAWAVRTAARAFAGDLGFDRLACLEIAILASELASNIGKYGVRGRISFEGLEHPRLGPGLRIVAVDVGPPFQDFAMALLDGFDDRGPLDPAALGGRRGIGGGLGAVQRFSHEVGWEPFPGGKRIWVVRYLARPARG